MRPTLDEAASVDLFHVKHESKQTGAAALVMFHVKLRAEGWPALALRRVVSRETCSAPNNVREPAFGTVASAEQRE